MTLKSRGGNDVKEEAYVQQGQTEDWNEWSTKYMVEKYNEQIQACKLNIYWQLSTFTCKALGTVVLTT